jgi:hypothetical protein
MHCQGIRYITAFDTGRGAQYLMGENQEVVWAEFSSLRWAVLLNSTINLHDANCHF